jgi:hypothetical protein
MDMLFWMLLLLLLLFKSVVGVAARHGRIQADGSNDDDENQW